MASCAQCSGPPPTARPSAKAIHRAAWECMGWGSSQCCPVRCAFLRLQDAFVEKHGVKLGFMSAFVKASADALHLVPAANAVIDGDEIVYRWAVRTLDLALLPPRSHHHLHGAALQRLVTAHVHGIAARYMVLQLCLWCYHP